MPRKRGGWVKINGGSEFLLTLINGGGQDKQGERKKSVNIGNG